MTGVVDDVVTPSDPCTMLPADLTGQTVLDVGCGTGSVARESVRRGAAAVVAVDIDDDHLDTARTFDAAQNLDSSSPYQRIDYRHADVEMALPVGPFDHVVCHNLLHRMRNPIAVLDRLIECASSSLIIDVTGIDAERPARLLRRDYDASVEARQAIASMPLALIGRDGTPGRKREQKFFFSAEALNNLLLEQRRYFSRLDVEPTGVGGRFLVRAIRRKVGHLVVVSGTTGSGKSTFLERLQACDPSLDQVSPQLNQEGLSRYQVTNSDGLRHLSGEVPQLLFHYDLLRPWRRDAAVHQRDEGLHVLDCSSRLDVVVVVAEASVLRARLTNELASLSEPGSRQGRRLQEVLELYANPDRLIARVQAWIEFCRSKGATPTFVDTSDGYRPISASEWAPTIRRGSSP